jgi:hypothetical protein
LQILQNRADEAGDEIGQAGRRAGTTSGLFSTLSFTSGGLSSSFVSLGTTAGIATVGITALTAGATALASTLFPLAAVLGTVVGGVFSLVAAFGAVVGTGILAFGEQRGEQNRERLEQINEQISRLEELKTTEEGLTESQAERLDTLKEEKDELSDLTGIMGGLKDVMSDVVEEIKPIITEFGEQFIPLVEDAIDALPDLIRNIFAAMGGMEEFVGALRNLGRIAFNTIPSLVGMLFDLARRALPVFLDHVRWLRNNGGDIFRGMLRVTQRLAPFFMDLINAFIEATPEITKLGSVVLEKLIPAFVGFIETIEDLVNLAEAEGGIVGFIKALANDALEWISGPGTSVIANIGDSVISGIMGALDPDGEGSTKIADFVTSLFSGIKTQLDNISEGDIENVVNSLSSILGTVFDGLVTSAQSDEAAALGGRIGELANTLMAKLGSQMFNYVTSEDFISDMARVALAVTNVLGAALREAFSTEPLVNAIFGEGTFQESGVNQLDTTAAGPGGGGTQNTNIEIEVTGDSQVVEDITARVMNDSERRTNRNTGRNPSL